MATRPGHTEAIVVRHSIMKRERELHQELELFVCLFVLIAGICGDTGLGFRAAYGSIKLSLGSYNDDNLNQKKGLPNPRDPSISAPAAEDEYV